MALSDPKTLVPVGNLALAKAVWPDRSHFFLRQVTYIGGSREKEIQREEDGIHRVERHLPHIYMPAENDGLLGHVAFALKHEIPNFGLLAKVFGQIQALDVATYVRASPTGAYARRIGFLFEYLTGTDLSPWLKKVSIGGNYVDLLDPEKLVTGPPSRNPKWRVVDNVPGTPAYAPLIERTPAVEKALKHNWPQDAADALKQGSPSDELMRRAINYLYRKETKSSFAIERETPNEARATRFVEALRRAGQGTVEEALSERRLTEIQNIITEKRYNEPAYRKNQNYVGSVVRRENLIEFIPPPPKQLPGLMDGLRRSVERLSHTEPIAQAAVASFGLVFHHPFNDGNGRLHRYLLHDIMARNKVMPSGLALPISAAILDDMGGYDNALEAFSKHVGAFAEYKLSSSGALSITNAEEAAWVWRYPDLTPQIEYLGRKIHSAVILVAEEVSYLVKYDRLAQKIKQIVDMPDLKLSELLTLLHENNGTLSKNKRKQRFKELTESEIRVIEKAYAQIFTAGNTRQASQIETESGTPSEQPRTSRKRM